MCGKLEESIFNYLNSVSSKARIAYLVWLNYNLCSYNRDASKQEFSLLNEIVLMVNKKLGVELQVIEGEYPADKEFCHFLAKSAENELIADVLVESLEEATVYSNKLN